MNLLKYDRGLILVYPHGTYIKDGKKLIVKTKNIRTIVNVPLLLIEKKNALGIIWLDYPMKINLEEFNKLKKLHMITEEERKEWWPKYQNFYAYQIIKKKIFKKKLLIEYPSGPQITIKPDNITIRKINIGLSGYNYPKMIDFRGNILAHYQKHLNSVEINYTFYQIPNKAFVDKLEKYRLTYSIKVPRLITHYKKLKNIKKEWNIFFHLFEPLKEQIICFLFQFPPNFIYNQKNYQKLERLTKILDNNYRYSFEFRDNTWLSGVVNQLFIYQNWTLVISHVSGWIETLKDGFNPSLSKYHSTSDIIYFRLHGSTGKYLGSYHYQTLNQIFKFIQKKKEKMIAIYFNNTDDESAWKDANKFIKKFNYLNIHPREQKNHS